MAKRDLNPGEVITRHEDSEHVLVSKSRSVVGGVKQGRSSIGWSGCPFAWLGWIEDSEKRSIDSNIRG